MAKICIFTHVKEVPFLLYHFFFLKKRPPVELQNPQMRVKSYKSSIKLLVILLPF